MARVPSLDFNTAEHFTSVASTRLQEARLSAVEAAAEVELSLGRPDQALRYLLELSDAHPISANGWPNCGSVRCINQDGRRMPSPCTRRFG